MNRCIILAVLVAFYSGLATADDKVELIHGGAVAGKTKKNEDSKLPYTLVELEDGLRVAIPRGAIRRTNADDVTEQYRQLAAKVADDPEAHFEMARWCTKNQLKSQSRFHMRRVVQLDPNHATARESLDFVKRGKEWIPRTQWERDRGLVRSAGRYHLPEDLAMQNAIKEATVASKRWVVEIAKLRVSVLRGGEKGAEALQTLRAINDPLAVPAIGDELTNPRNRKQPVALRRLWIDLLGRFQVPAAVEPLVRIGVQESDPVIREAALEQLEKYGARSAVLTYVPMLKSPNNQEVNHAARALAYLPEPEIRFELVDALITEHTQRSGPTTDMKATFGQDGGGGLQMGGKPQEKKEWLRNPQVLAALRVIAPEVDYQYDQAAWRQHFARQLSSYSGQMRRDF